MVNRSSETLGFGSSRLSTLSTLPECQVSGLQDLLPRILSQSTTRIFFAALGFRAFPSTSPQISQSAKILEVLSFLHVSSPDQWLRLTPAFGSSRLKATCNSNSPEYQVSRPWDLAPHVYCNQWLRWTPTFGLQESSTPTSYALNPLECQVSGLWDLLPRVLSRSTVRIYSTLRSFRGFTFITLHSFRMSNWRTPRVFVSN
jgi:hypothetical protein